MGRKDPYNPAKEGSASAAARRARAELGLPLVERYKKSPNIEFEDISEGVTRTRHRFLLTTPEARRACYEEIKRAQQAAGTFGQSRIYIAETMADRFLDSEEHAALCWFLKTHVSLNFPGAGVSGYSGERKPRGEAKPPLGSPGRTLYMRIRTYLPPKQLAFLDWLARHEYAITESGEVEQAALKGRHIIGSKDERRGIGGCEGYLAAIAETIGYWRHKCSLKRVPEGKLNR